ncbi:MAG: MmgE/PrpD family protein [Pseudomonadota bacterium]
MSAAIENIQSNPLTTLSQQVGGYAQNFDLSQVPQSVKHYAKLCMADAIGIGFASHNYGFSKNSLKAITTLSGAGDFPVIGTDLKISCRDAALANGILVHGLDFDDTHVGGVIHGTASAVPLVLAQGTRFNSSGAQSLAAYLLAIETDARIGMLAKGMFQKIGFHPTGMVGIFGCSVAGGYLAGLSPEQIALSQGIALSMASGSLEFLDDGSWTKRMHPGWSASSAITACALAEQDFKAPLKAYEGRYGLYNLYLQDQELGDASQIMQDLGQNWETSKVAIKPYPVCHFNHGCIDSMRELRSKHDLTPSDLKSITVMVHDKQADVVCLPEVQKRRPQNEYEGKFSLHFAVAATAIRGNFTLAELEDDALQDAEILALCDRISYQHDDESAYPKYYSGAVKVETLDGQTLFHRELINRGADERALSESDVKDKFIGNVRNLTDPQAEELWQAVMELDSAPSLERLNNAIGVDVRS